MAQTYSVAAGWRKSSRCEGGHCVEVAFRDGGVAMRNSTVPDLQLQLSVDAWRSLVAGLRAGEFDIS
jgi:hypothetical protein